ncbi:MAG: hypothetical protein JWP12_235 [Bacteroidetes bacterium]|nr:hypothetical protein [Bacteroidota bacterium]
MKKTLTATITCLLLAMSLQAQTFNYYFGNIHSQSSYSDGNVDSATSLITTPLQDFNYAKLSQHLDFYGISDHNHLNAGMLSPANFHKGLADANTANADGSFVAMYGQEWGVISGGGHVVVYGYDSLMGWDAGDYDVHVAQNDYATLWKRINMHPGAFGYLAHPQSGDYTNLFTTARNVDADSAIIGMAARSGPAFSTNSTYSDPSTSTYIARYNDALKRGYHLGVGLDHDTHNSVFGRQTMGRLVVLAPSLTRENILDALRRMRFYSSDDWNVKVDFNIGSYPMGSVFSHTGTPTISVTVTDPDGELTSSIKLYYGVPGSGTAPTVLTSNTNSNTLTYTHPIANLAQYYYYLEITQTDGNKIWTSPIWYKRNDATSSTPVADFTTLSTTVCAGSPVMFNDASTNSPTAWSWSFPGATPATSVAHTPTVTYTTPGTYNVTLTASNPSGTNTYTHTSYITVNPGIPTPTISQVGNVLTSSATTGNQWYWNGTLILGATNQSFTYSLNGSYTVMVNTSGCASAMSAPLVTTATGIGEIQNVNGFNVYPNPNDGNFNVTFTAASKASYTINISNALGQLIYHDVITDFTGTYTKQLSVSEYGKGVYTVSLTNEKNETVKKIIIY